MPASGRKWVDWEVCEQCKNKDGNGVRLPDAARCWAHADDQELAAGLQRLSQGAELDARGVSISGELLLRLLDAAPRDPKRPNSPLLAAARFDHATFGDGIWFDAATFSDHAGFGGATFGDYAGFGGATFGDYAGFDGATFGDRAGFGSATFGDVARFEGATFGDRAGFWGATFGDHAGFGGATFGDHAQFGPVLVIGRLSLRQAAFGGSPELIISAERLDCQGVRFLDGAYLRLRWAEVALDDARFERPSVLAAAPPIGRILAAAEETRLVPRLQPAAQRTPQPRPLCLAGCDVANLVLDSCDLRACRVTGAHSLSGLRLEGATLLPTTPPGWHRGKAFPPIWQWARRQTIVEEHIWRQHQRKRSGWRGTPPPALFITSGAWHEGCQRRALGDPTPAEIAVAYRALRKGQEESGDAPGAADFYYGEMEMRRHDRTKPWAERTVVWLYWLVSGYALRASRALAWLVGVLMVATVLLATVGLVEPAESTSRAASGSRAADQRPVAQPPPAQSTDQSVGARLGTAALVAVEGAVFRSSDQALTYTGRVIQLVLRFLGPVLLGLVVLSIRGRVKR